MPKSKLLASTKAAVTRAAGHLRASPGRLTAQRYSITIALSYACAATRGGRVLAARRVGCQCPGHCGGHGVEVNLCANSRPQKRGRR